ncbi:MAG: tyrosine-type recombinase/integrase [Thermoplasmatota archaeon]
MPYIAADGLARILDDIVNQENRSTLGAYLEEQRANGVRASSLLNQANHIRHWALFLGPRPFTAATREDVRRFTNLRTSERTWCRPGSSHATVKKIQLSNGTLNLRTVILKAFQRWVRGGDKHSPYPPEVAWLHQKRSTEDDALPVEQILTPDELRLLVEAAPDTQTRALLAVLYDSGARASEFCALHIKDVIFDEHGAILALPKDGTNLKTGARRIRIITSSPYLKAWINAHPLARDSRAPLWLAMSHRSGLGDGLQSQSLGYVVSTAAKRACLTKEVYPHLFRHSRATLAAKEGWPESVMRAHFGWSRTSDMPSRYIHLAGKDADDFILAAAGVKPQPRTNTLAALAPKVCACGTLNPPTGEYCVDPKCNRPLTLTAAAPREESTIAVMKERLLREWLPELLQAIDAQKTPPQRYQARA